jgi:hypothetical protein
MHRITDFATAKIDEYASLLGPQVKGDLPDGLACRFRVQPLLQKYSGFPKTQITLYPLPSRPDQRGVGHRRERWGGLRWTRQRRVCKGSQGGLHGS